MTRSPRRSRAHPLDRPQGRKRPAITLAAQRLAGRSDALRKLNARHAAATQHATETAEDTAAYLDLTENDRVRTSEPTPPIVPRV